MEKRDTPLSGIRVLDLCRRYPGAYACMFLGDFGAEVIKVDPPGPAYAVLPFDPNGEKQAAYFVCDRNKKSIVMNLKSAEGREAFHRLVKTADVLVEGYRPGVMKGLGADYETLKKINPKLIYCSVSGYGQDGPYARMPGHDMDYIGIGGALSLIGPRDGAPCLPGNLLADMAGGGLNGVIGILLALAAREKTGRGQHVDISYTDGAISLLAYFTSRYFGTGVVPRRGEASTNGGAPWAQVFKCKDGEYFTIGCLEASFWENLCRALGLEDCIPHRNATGTKRDEVVGKIAAVFLTRTRDEWFAFLKDKEACGAPVNNLEEAFADPQVRHRQMLVELEHPKLGKIKQAGIPIKLSETPGAITSLGVAIGTNTDEVLEGLGYSAEQLARLRELGAIG